MTIATNIRAYALGIGLLAAGLTPCACGGSASMGVDGGDDGAGAGTSFTTGAGAGTTSATGAGPDTGTSSSGCSPSPVSCDVANIVGTWEWVHDNNPGATVTWAFNGNGTYTGAVFTEPTPGSFDEQKETGTYMVEGSLLTLTPAGSTCPIVEPARIYVCAEADGDLFLTDSSGNVAGWASDTNPAPPNPALGCFTNGVWEPAP